MIHKKKMNSTPSQTVGPFFRNYLNFTKEKFPFTDTSNIKLKFKKVIITGNIIYNKNIILKDGFLEYWQEVQYKGKINFLNFNRIKSRDEKINKFIITINQYETFKYANSVNIIIFSRGLLNHLYTKIYFEDEMYSKNNIFYNSIPSKRRNTLIAKLDKTNNGIKYYSFNIFLNGVNETVFFENQELQ